MKTIKILPMVILVSLTCDMNTYAVTKAYAQGSNSPQKTDKVVAKVLNREIFLSEIEPGPKQIEINKKELSEESFRNWRKYYRNDRLSGYIFGSLLREFEKEHDVEPTPEEIKAQMDWLNAMEKNEEKRTKQRKQELLIDLESEDLDEEQRSKIQKEIEMYDQFEAIDKEIHQGSASRRNESRRRISHQMIKAWKRKKSLYEKYGGRVIFQQFGPEPVDAYRDFLKEHQAKGNFEIVDEEFKELFWEYFVGDKHSFYSEEEGRKFMTTPMWEMEIK